MISLSAAYQQKKNAASQGQNRLAHLTSARNAQNQNIKETRRTQKLGSAIQGAVVGAKLAGPWGAAAGGAIGLLLG